MAACEIKYDFLGHFKKASKIYCVTRDVVSITASVAVNGQASKREPPLAINWRLYSRGKV
jgi:hypothetical protein